MAIRTDAWCNTCSTPLVLSPATNSICCQCGSVEIDDLFNEECLEGWEYFDVLKIVKTYLEWQI